MCFDLWAKGKLQHNHDKDINKLIEQEISNVNLKESHEIKERRELMKLEIVA